MGNCRNPSGWNFFLDETQFPLNLLEVEITESLVIREGSEVINELNRLEESGVSIAMDDFGTGQQDFLHAENCDQLQGYLLARPLPAQELNALLSEQKPAAH